MENMEDCDWSLGDTAIGALQALLQGVSDTRMLHSDMLLTPKK